MLELLLSGSTRQVGPWNGEIPKDSDNTIFRMYDFKTTADIRDKSVSAVAVTNTSATVGTDALGTYVNLQSGSASLAFANTKLNSANVDINLIVGGLQQRPGQYDHSILDCRPLNTNGPYLGLSFPRLDASPSPFYVMVYWNNVTPITTRSVFVGSEAYHFTISIRPNGTTIYVNGVSAGTTTERIDFINQQIKISKAAYTVVPNGRFKLYYMDIKKITV